MAGSTAIIKSQLFDGESQSLRSNLNVYFTGERIEEVSERKPSETCNVIDAGGRTLIPGLIDAHIHAYANDVNVNVISNSPPTLYAHHARIVLGNMLDRGFTTVRDTGGADYGLHLAIAQGYFPSPRLFYCGKGISMTGGHGDFRHPHHHHPKEDCSLCGCNSISHLMTVVDGVPSVLRAVRENLRRGASFIKLMGSGGVSSTGDSISGIQFSDEEVSAIVSEVERHEVYCTAHIHPDRALRRAIELGVHCIEHGTLVEPETAQLATESGTNVVPTLAIIAGLAEHGEELGYPKESLEKLDAVKDDALQRLEFYKRAGTTIGFGTDLIGKLERLQCTEFALRSNVYSALEILQQATSVNADIIGQRGELGVIKQGAYADMLLVDGNPLDDISVLENDGGNLPLIVKNGEIYKNELPLILSPNG